MNKEKQTEIKEIAEIILDVDRSYYGMECDEIPAKAEASAIYDKGYRKASEVAREIFAEIKSTLDTVIWSIYLEIKSSRAAGFYSDAKKLAIRKKAFEYAKDYLAELKKKYTEGGENAD